MLRIGHGMLGILIVMAWLASAASSVAAVIDGETAGSVTAPLSVAAASLKQVAQADSSRALRERSPNGDGAELIQIICEGGEVVHGRWIPCVCPAGHTAEGGPIHFRCVPRLRANPDGSGPQGGTNP